MDRFTTFWLCMCVFSSVCKCACVCVCVRARACVLRNHMVLQENAQHVSRFIALASVSNPAKKKVREGHLQEVSFKGVSFNQITTTLFLCQIWVPWKGRGFLKSRIG